MIQIADMDAVLAHSFRDFHTKGFDYICLKRSAEITEKLYFFDGDVNKLPEVVNPHDHRYNFTTTVIAGRSENILYAPSTTLGQVFQAFDYDTPLNDGIGFVWAGEQRLFEIARRSYDAHDLGYAMNYDQIHTIRMVENETVLLLRQHQDIVPIGIPTKTFTRDREPPKLDGLYNRFTADQIVAKLKRLDERVPGVLG